MSSESDKDPSTLALAPMVRMFAYAVIKTMKNKNFSERKNVLHADMVPRLSQNIIHASMGERTLRYSENKMEPSMQIPQNASMAIPSPAPELIPQEQKTQGPPIQNIPIPNEQVALQIPSMMQPVASQPKPSLVQAPKSQIKNNFPPKPIHSNPPIGQMMAPPPQQMAPPGSPEGSELTQFYGKITPLLDDPSVTVIECSGAGRPVMVVRMGQKQPSKIVLGEKDISQVLNKVSESAHIPLLEGVFRAAVDTFTINAVISEMIGSRFIIKKQPMGPPPMGPPGMGLPPR